MSLKITKLVACLIAALAAALLFASCGVSSGDTAGRTTVDIKRSMNSVVTVAADKSEGEENADLDGFRNNLSVYIDNINGKSKDTDMLSFGDCYEGEDVFSAVVSTRRLNEQIVGLGSIIGGSSKNFVENNTKNLETVEDFYEGFISEKLFRIYSDGSVATHEIKSRDNDISLKAKSVNSGEIISFEDFKVALVNNNYKILFFELVDLEYTDEIVFNLPGNVKYLSAMIDGGSGEEIRTLSAEGSTVTVKATPLVFSTGEKQAFFGYFVYEESLSPWAIAGIVVGVAALLALAYFGFIKGGFKAFFAGKVWKRMVRYKFLYLLLLPAFSLVIIFRYMPMLWLSAGFMDYNLLEGLGSEWVGLKYFKGVFFATNTAEMYRIFRNTIFISLIRIASNLPVILLLAMLVNSIKNRKIRTAFQTVSFIPYFLSWVAVGGIFNALLNPNNGVINGVFGLSTNWYGDPEPWWAILSVSSLWKGMGWGTLIYISAMCNIDGELYEACSLDGGGTLRQLWTVTLPGIMNIICLQLILDVSNIMRDNYEQILAMTNGQVTGPIQETVDVVGRISYTALSKGNFGSATAIGLIQGVIGSILVLITNKIVKKTENEGII
ncbi:MAG: sugar ABC transporter permease [Clostridia bacterium]|nr:sugar ABC transporter permease [Clostridia bacterium]